MERKWVISTKAVIIQLTNSKKTIPHSIISYCLAKLVKVPEYPTGSVLPVLAHVVLVRALYNKVFINPTQARMLPN